MGARAFASAIAAAIALTVAATSQTIAQEWTAYTSAEEGFAVEAPGNPQFDHSGFDPKTMTSVRNHTWPKASGDGAFIVGIMFRNSASKAQAPDAVMRDQIAEAKGNCHELRDERAVEIPGGVAKEFVIDKCSNGSAFKGRVYVLDDRIVAVAAVGPSAVDQAADTPRFLDSFKLTAVVPAEWKAYTVMPDGFSIDLPGRPTVKEGGFHPNTYTSGRVHEAETRLAHYAVTAAVRNRAGMTAVPNEQFLGHLMNEMKKGCETREQQLSVSGGIGAEFVQDKCPNGAALMGRFYLIDDRLYQLVASWPAGMEQRETSQFFASFRLITAPGPVVAAPPPSAPQTARPADSIPKSAPPKEAGVASAFESAMKRFPDSPGAGTPGTTQQRQATAPQAAPPATAKWGALAIDVDDSDPSYGVGGGDSEAKASDNALRFCRRAGGKGCKIVVTYNQCAAYAVSRTTSASGKGGTQKAAEAQALDACKDRCKIVVSDCN
jgi:hypothetical protein